MKAKVINNALDAFSWIIRHTCNLNPRTIIFTSKPDYADNSRALSDYLVNNGFLKKYDIYWVVENAATCRKDHPDAKVKFIENKGWNRFKNLKTFVTASWQFGTHGVAFYRENRIKGQHIIRLWHGCSYKDKDLTLLTGCKNKAPFDYALVSGPLFEETKSYFWNCSKDKILPLGYPRYDWLRENTAEAMKLVEMIKGDNDKIIVWMPTFRNDKNGRYTDNDNITQFPLMVSDEAWESLDAICNASKVVVIVKLHPFQKDYDISWGNFTNIRQITNSDFNQANTTMYNFLAVTDGLITDYSSVGVDYMIVDKPIAFTLDDYELYKDGRGFVVKNVLDYMPGYHLYSLEDLMVFIKDISNGVDKYKQNRDSLIGTLIHKSDCYCKEIAVKLGL